VLSRLLATAAITVGLLAATPAAFAGSGTSTQSPPITFPVPNGFPWCC
jgi:hypothetical protein